MRKRARSMAVASLALLAALATPADSRAGQSLDGIQAALVANQMKWEEKGGDDYSYQMTRSCYCVPAFVAPGIVEVRDGEITEVSPVAAPGSLDPANYLTIEGLFAVIQGAIDRNAHAIIVTWNAQLGYPSDISIDYDVRIADEEVAYSARNLVLGTGYEEDQGALDDALAAWAAGGVAHYRFRMRRSCFCLPESTRPGIVEVLHDEIVSAVDPDTAAPLSPEYYLTVPELFATVQDAIDGELWTVTAAYDSILGYPTSIFIDYGEFIADDIITYAASDLVDLPEPRALPLQLAALAALCSLSLLRKRAIGIAAAAEFRSAPSRR